MRGNPGDTTQIDLLLQLLESGGERAIVALIEATSERLRYIARKKLAGFPAVRTQAETDDVLQEALLKLDRALRVQTPATAREYLGLAALQIERVLLDLARKFRGRSPAELMDDSLVQITTESLKTDDWVAFHEAVERLPEPPQYVFRLHYYLGLTQDQIAQQVDQSRKTVGHQIRRAKLLLAERLVSDQPPANAP
jgi:RNA polymerase sigma-70 factor (ECF subfamily)